MTTPSPLLRTRGGHEAGRVTYIELFFDLVFVFAVTQLSHSLIEHFSWHGALETLLMLLAVWWAWIYTSWVTNWLDPAKVAVRAALLALMLLGLILSASIPQAFETRGLVFAGAYVALQCGRCLFFLWAVRGQPGLVANFQRILVWFLASAVFWLMGAMQDGSARLALLGDRGRPGVQRRAGVFPRARPGPLHGRRLGRRRQPPCRTLRPVHDHRARRIDPGHRRDLRRHAVERQHHRRLPRLLRRQHRDVVAVFRRDGRSGRGGDRACPRSGPPGAV